MIYAHDPYGNMAAPYIGVAAAAKALGATTAAISLALAHGGACKGFKFSRSEEPITPWGFTITNVHTGKVTRHASMPEVAKTLSSLSGKPCSRENAMSLKCNGRLYMNVWSVGGSRI